MLAVCVESGTIVAKTVPIEHAYSYAQAIMVAVPREHWLFAAKRLAGEPAHWAEGYEEVLRASLASRIMEGPSSIRLAAQIIANDDCEEAVTRAVRSVLERMKAHESQPPR
jgi:hypothetical protein